jgi:L-ascorbate metabolism protein UlaG (beta-lactamase superfamily)
MRNLLSWSADVPKDCEINMKNIDILAVPLANPHSAILHPRVKLEPLVDRWYAWPHLLSPVQQALNLAFRYLPTAKSFIAAPTVHAAANRDPAMFGGPFMALRESEVEAVRTYIQETETSRAEALSLARSIRDFDAILQRADGYSLDEFRATMPELLRGRLEIVYGLNNHPKIRLLEEMFLEDDLGHRQAQGILLHRELDPNRPFFLSTLRLPTKDEIFVKAPFGSSVVKSLCAARASPVDLFEIAPLLGQTVQALASYFCNPGISNAQRYSGDGVRIRYFGHACLLIETKDTSVLVDPTCAQDSLADCKHFTFSDIPRIDILFISHGHQDHFCPEMLMQLRSRVERVLVPPNNRGEIADPSLRRMLRSLGYNHVDAIEPLEPYGLPDGTITALPFSGEHCDLDIHSKHCALIELRGRRICLFIDSDAIDIDSYKRLRARLINPDIMFIGMECFGAPLSWLYGPLIPRPITKRIDGSRRLSAANCERAWRLTDDLRPDKAFIYAMGQEPWMRCLMGLNYNQDSVQLRESSEFMRRCDEHGISVEHLYLQREIELCERVLAAPT